MQIIYCFKSDTIFVMWYNFYLFRGVDLNLSLPFDFESKRPGQRGSEVPHALSARTILNHWTPTQFWFDTTTLSSSIPSLGSDNKSRHSKICLNVSLKSCHIYFSFCNFALFGRVRLFASCYAHVEYILNVFSIFRRNVWVNKIPFKKKCIAWIKHLPKLTCLTR